MIHGKDDGDDKGGEGPVKGPWDDAGSERGRRTQDDAPKQSRGRRDDVPPSNPWARREGPSSNNGNSMDDFIDGIQERIKKIISGGGSSGRNSNGGPSKGNRGMITFFLIGAVVLWLGTGLYRVQEGEVGVVLRFGEMVRTSLPGLQYHLPAPIESVIVQKLDAFNTIDSGMKNDRGVEAGDATLILTGDENMVHTNYTIVWKIKDPSEYLFTARNPDTTIRAAAESVVREVIGQTTARLALTEGRGQIEVRSQEILQKLLDQYKMGVQIMSIQLQNVAPPHQVVGAFNDLQASLVNADQSLNEAEAYRNEVIPRAEGQAVRAINEAEAYSQRIVAEAEGEGGRFEQVRIAYNQNKAITLKRYHLEAMREVLLNTNKFILDEKVGKGVLPYLPLNELKGRPRESTGEKGASK